MKGNIQLRGGLYSNLDFFGGQEILLPWVKFWADLNYRRWTNEPPRREILLKLTLFQESRRFVYEVLQVEVGKWPLFASWCLEKS